MTGTPNKDVPDGGKLPETSGKDKPKPSTDNVPGGSTKGDGKGGKGPNDSATREELTFQRISSLIRDEIFKGLEGSWDRVMELVAQCPNNYAESLNLRMVTGAKIAYACVRGGYMEVTGSGFITGQTKAIADNSRVFYKFPREVWEFFIKNSHTISAMLGLMAGVVHGAPATVQRALATCWFSEIEEPWKVPSDERLNASSGTYIRMSASRDGDISSSTYFLPPELIPYRTMLLTARKNKCIWILARVSGGSEVNKFDHVHAHIGSVTVGIRGELNRVRKVCAGFYHELLAINAVAAAPRWICAAHNPVYDDDAVDELDLLRESGPSSASKRRRGGDDQNPLMK